MWQCFLDIVDVISKIAQTGIAAFAAWLAWRTFLKTEVQESTTESEVEQPAGDVEDIKLFDTSKQTTWLRSTPRGIECHLDERREGKSGGLKWTLAPNQVKGVLATGDIHVNPSFKIRTGLLSIGRHTNWLYSKSLHPDPAQLHHDVIKLMKSVNA